MKKLLIIGEMLLICLSAFSMLFGLFGFLNISYILANQGEDCSIEVAWLILSPFLIGIGLLIDWLVPKLITWRRKMSF